MDQLTIRIIIDSQLNESTERADGFLVNRHLATHTWRLATWRSGSQPRTSSYVASEIRFGRATKRKVNVKNTPEKTNVDVARATIPDT